MAGNRHERPIRRLIEEHIEKAEKKTEVEEVGQRNGEAGGRRERRRADLKGVHGVRVRENNEGIRHMVGVHPSSAGRRKSIRVGSERNARRVAERIEAELKLGRTLESGRPTAPKLGDYFERFQRTYLATAVRESTAFQLRVELPSSHPPGTRQ